jgi:hypothetical protein
MTYAISIETWGTGPSAFTADHTEELLTALERRGARGPVVSLRTGAASLDAQTLPRAVAEEARTTEAVSHRVGAQGVGAEPSTSPSLGAAQVRDQAVDRPSRCYAILMA